MNLTFSVLFTEPLTAREARLVNMGVRINPITALRRWAARDKRNKFKNIVYVEQPTKKKAKG